MRPSRITCARVIALSVRAVRASARCAATVIATVALMGCMGAGDDSAVHVSPVEGGSDGGGASDAIVHDHQPIVAETSGDDAGQGGDGTTEGGDGGASLTGPAHMLLSSTGIDFGTVSCGTISIMQVLTITNAGGEDLIVSTSILGSLFNVDKTTLQVAPGSSGTLIVGAAVPANATAGAPLTGSLALFSNDPMNANRTVQLSATPSGATLSGPAFYVFASSEVGYSAAPVAFYVQNTGNATATYSFGDLTDPSVAFNPPPSSLGTPLAPGAIWSTAATFTPSRSGNITSRTAITVQGVTCGNGISSVSFSGLGATGVLSGWPSTGVLDFGSAPCGGAAPTGQQITLHNTSSTTTAHVVSVDTTGANRFATDVTPGAEIPSSGSLVMHFTAPAVPGNAALTPITGTIVIHTDTEVTGRSITLTEEPQGAVLSFDTSGTTNFGSFGSEILLQSQAQNFKVVNSGNAPASVTLMAVENGADAGAPSAGDAMATPTGPFFVSVPSFTVAQASAGLTLSTEAEQLTFEPMHSGVTVGALSMAVGPSTALCGSLPSPLPVTGTASGGGPVVAPTTLSFPATCGGSAPPTQSFSIANSGTVDLNWSRSGATGPGASQYTVTGPMSGMLTPGQSATVQVSALAVPSPVSNPNPAAFAAQISITTDVPLDPTHVVNLVEVPLGDQLSLSVGNLRFGQVPLNTTLSQSFGLSNNANPGSPDALVSFTVSGTTSGGGAAYSLQTAGDIAAGASASEMVTFDAASGRAYPASITLSTSDALCTPLPGALTLTGTGTNGQLSLSTTTLAFGTDPNDPKGYVQCGGTGTARTLSLSNVGNQALKITGLALGKGTSSPFALSGVTTPLTLTIGGSASLTITPSAIPASVTDPNDPTVYSDTLTITTDASGDTAHTVSLAMQPYGAVIKDTPVQGTWTFGTISGGSIGTFTTTIRNAGNAPATVSLEGLNLPSVFGLQNNPTTASPNSVAALVGQFTPPSQNGTWVDQGHLVVRAPSSFCAPLPSQWVSPTVNVSGSSNATPPVTVSGTPVFPTTDCGGSPPSGQSVTLTNLTNGAYTYTARLNAGTWYTYTDSGSSPLDAGASTSSSGHLAANGIVTFIVNPKTVSPGPGVQPGPAPYYDDLVITVATTPSTIYTVPISWTLNGAVLALAQGSGPNGQGFYVADSTSGFTLPIDNSGTAPAAVNFSIQPSGAFSVQPTPPIQVLPNIRALPELVSTSSSAACPTAGTSVTANGSLTFLYSGPVCRPLGLSSVAVYSCSGTYTP